MERRILHLQVPAFPVSVLRVVNPKMRRRPVAILSQHTTRAVLTSVSSEARSEGVRIGMCLSEARANCRGLLVTAADPALEKRGWQALHRLASACTPLVEPTAAGRLFADLTGTSRLLGASRDTAARIQRDVMNQLRLPCTIGLSSNKLVSDIACHAAPAREFSHVAPGDEVSFLSPLPALFLPAARGSRQRRLLSDLNLRRVTDVSALPLSRLLLAFRECGYSLFRQARGQDDSPVRPPSRSPLVRVEETLAQESLDDDLLRSILFLLVERAGRRLRAGRHHAGNARLALRAADGQYERRHLRLTPSDEGDARLFRRLEPVLDHLTLRRQRIRWLELTLSGLQQHEHQMNLFTSNNPHRDTALSRTLDTIRRRYGEGAVRRRRPLPELRER